MCDHQPWLLIIAAGVIAIMDVIGGIASIVLLKVIKDGAPSGDEKLGLSFFF